MARLADPPVRPGSSSLLWLPSVVPGSAANPRGALYVYMSSRRILLL